MQEAYQSIDTLLLPYLKATDEFASQDFLTELIRQHADPVIRRVLRSKLQLSFYSAGNSANHQEADDVYGDVIAQLLTELRTFRSNPIDNPIHHLPGFVARLTLNACYKHLRTKYPQRHNLKNKIRYLLTRQAGFAIWEKQSRGLVCGYAAWRERKDERFHSFRLQEICNNPNAFVSQTFSSRLIQKVNPAELVAAIFNYVGHAFEVDILVNLLAEVWGVTDRYESLDERRADGTSLVTELADLRADVGQEISHRFYLQQLWKEICALPINQRTALLLGLRDSHGNSVVPLLPALGITSIIQIAKALELEADDFARLWFDLPLEDSRIASLLGLTRQQIINLRKSGRERLARRVKDFQATA